MELATQPEMPTPDQNRGLGSRHLGALVIGLLLGCSLESAGPGTTSQLVGRWQRYLELETVGPSAVEFFSDHTCLFEEDKEAQPCRWVLLEDGRVKIERNYWARPEFLFAGSDYQYFELDLGSGKVSRYLPQETADLRHKSWQLQKEGKVIEAVAMAEAAGERGSAWSYVDLARLSERCDAAGLCDPDGAVRYLEAALTTEKSEYHRYYINLVRVEIHRDRGELEEAILVLDNMREAIDTNGTPSGFEESVDLRLDIQTRLDLIRQLQG